MAAAAILLAFAWLNAPPAIPQVKLPQARRQTKAGLTRAIGSALSRARAAGESPP